MNIKINGEEIHYTPEVQQAMNAWVKAFNRGELNIYGRKVGYVDEIRQPTGIEPTIEDIEKISAEIHGVYCKQYQKNNGSPYRTNGDYSKLDEPTKDYDRVLVRWIIKRFGTPKERLVELDVDDVANVLFEYMKHLGCARSATVQPARDIVERFGTRPEVSVEEIERIISEILFNNKITVSCQNIISEDYFVKVIAKSIAEYVNGRK